MLKINKSTRRAGSSAETAALNYLQAQGLSLITRNFNSKLGEIDLIMQDRQHIVFIEVRMRNNPDFVSALESVDFRKQQKIFRTALLFLQKHKLLDASPCRFDIVTVRQKGANNSLAKTPGQETRSPEIDWIRDAFQPG